jgi:hypothetical protein
MSDNEFDPIDSNQFIATLGEWVLERVKSGDTIPDPETIDILKRGFRAGFKYGQE